MGNERTSYQLKLGRLDSAMKNGLRLANLGLPCVVPAELCRELGLDSPIECWPKDQPSELSEMPRFVLRPTDRG